MRCGQFLQRYHECADRREHPEDDPQLAQHAAACPHCSRWLAVQRLWEGRWEDSANAPSIGADTLPDWTSPLPDEPTEPAVVPVPAVPTVAPPAEPYRMAGVESLPLTAWQRTWMSMAAAALLFVVARHQFAPLGGRPAVAPRQIAETISGAPDDRSNPHTLVSERGMRGDLVRRRDSVSSDLMGAPVWHGPIGPLSPVLAVARSGVLEHDPWAQWGSDWGLDQPWSIVRRPWESVRSVRPDWVDPLVSHLRPLSRRMERAWSLLLRTWGGRTSDPVMPDASAAEERLELLRRVC